MTKKEFDFVCSTLIQTAKKAYACGYDDHKAGMQPADAQFALTPANKLRLKTEIDKLDTAKRG